MGKNGKLIEFRGIKGTVYNSTPPLWFNVDGETVSVILGRNEKRDEYAHSRVLTFLRHRKYIYDFQIDLPMYWAEDPFGTTIWTERGKEIVVGIVEMRSKTGSRWDVITAFYRGLDLLKLERFLEVPGKDSRLVQKRKPGDKSGPIVFFDRPQGGDFGLGLIRMTEFKSLDHITEKGIRKGKILEDIFPPGWWGGVNEPHYNWQNDRISFIGHAACDDFPYCENSVVDIGFDLGKWSKRYLTIYCEVGNTPIVIAEWNNFPDYLPKFSQLNKVIFPSGIVFEGKTPELYVGFKDACEMAIPITHPAILKMY